jgi:hypothetical protein
MFSATPGMSYSPGLAGIHSGAPVAPPRDFLYNLRKLRKCQHMYLAETADRGVGVFAAREFAPGDIVMMDFDGDYYEQTLSYRELCERNIDLKYPLQVGVICSACRPEAWTISRTIRVTPTPGSGSTPVAQRFWRYAGYECTMKSRSTIRPISIIPMKRSAAVVEWQRVEVS